MTVTLRHADLTAKRNETRMAVLALVLAAVAVVSVRAVVGTQDSSPAGSAGAETQPSVVDPVGLGAALSVTYDSGGVRAPADPVGLGAALSVSYDDGRSGAVVDPIGLGAALAVTFDAERP